MSSSSTINTSADRPASHCDAILRIANQDAAAVYRDLSDFQITLAAFDPTAGTLITT